MTIEEERDALAARVEEWRPIVERMAQLQGWAATAARVSRALAEVKPDDGIRAARAKLWARIAAYIAGDKAVPHVGKEEERRAWARLVKAERVVTMWQTNGLGHAEAERKLALARQALRDRDVDIEKYLG